MPGTSIAVPQPPAVTARALPPDSNAGPTSITPTTIDTTDLPVRIRSPLCDLDNLRSPPAGVIVPAACTVYRTPSQLMVTLKATAADGAVVEGSVCQWLDCLPLSK